MTELLDDLRAEHDDLQQLVAQVDLEAPTPAEPWSVRDTVAHLAAFDEEATKAATTPQLFLAGLPSIAEDIDGSPIPFRSLQDGWDAVGPVVDDVALYPGEQPPF